MATATNPNSAWTGQSWALPLAVIILVAGSLVFWTCVGLFWLVARQATQQPIVIWMPPAANANDQTCVVQVDTACAPQDR